MPPLPISSPVLGVEWGYLLDSFFNIFVKLRKTFRFAALDEFPSILLAFLPSVLSSVLPSFLSSFLLSFDPSFHSSFCPSFLAILICFSYVKAPMSAGFPGGMAFAVLVYIYRMV